MIDGASARVKARPSQGYVTGNEKKFAAWLNEHFSVAGQACALDRLEFENDRARPNGPAYCGLRCALSRGIACSVCDS